MLCPAHGAPLALIPPDHTNQTLLRPTLSLLLPLHPLQADEIAALLRGRWPPICLLLLQPLSLVPCSPSASSRLLSITLLVLARSSQKDPCSLEVLGCGSCFGSVLCEGFLRLPEPRAPSSWHPALAAGCGSCPDVSFLARATQMLLAKHSGGPRWKVCLHFQLGFCHLIANTAWSSTSLGSFSPLFER